MCRPTSLQITQAVTREIFIYAQFHKIISHKNQLNNIKLILLLGQVIIQRTGVITLFTTAHPLITIILSLQNIKGLKYSTVAIPAVHQIRYSFHLLANHNQIHLIVSPSLLIHIVLGKIFIPLQFITIEDHIYCSGFNSPTSLTTRDHISCCGFNVSS